MTVCGEIGYICLNNVIECDCSEVYLVIDPYGR